MYDYQCFSAAACLPEVESSRYKMIVDIMTIKESILDEINSIRNPILLNKLEEYIQLMKLDEKLRISNREAVLKYAGSISDKEANDLKRLIDKEFNQKEGDWKVEENPLKR